jgi:hypothetical protein
MATRLEEPKLQMVCGTCGSKLVTRDAWAGWSEDEQDWILGAAYDYSFCHFCDGETRIQELPLN